MSFEEVGVAGVAAYLVGLILVAEWAKRRKVDASPGDHFLAGRDLGVFVLFLTLYATAYSGNSLLGYPGKAYRTGFSFIMATGFMMSIIVAFHALVPRLRPLSVVHGFITPGDWVRLRFAPQQLDPVVGSSDTTERAGQVGAETWETRCGRWLVLSVALLMSLALANFLLAQLKAMGQVADVVTGGRIPFEAGVVGLAVVILFYETRGGMRAVAWTDAAQGILMFMGLAALLAWLVTGAGGIAEVTRSVTATRPAAVAVPDAIVCANWASTIVLLGLASVIYPQAIQRIYAAKSGASLRAAMSFMTFMPLATTFVVTLIGVAAISRVDVSLGEAADRVMPVLLAQWAEAGPWGIAGATLVFIGALSAIMSTADSCLLSLGSLVVRDVLGMPSSDARTTVIGKWIAAAILFATIPLALQRDLTLWRLIELKMELLIQCVPAFLLALHWQKLRASWTLLGLLVGTAFGVSLTLAGVPRLYGLHVGVVGLVINTAIAVAGSAAAGTRSIRAGTHAVPPHRNRR